MSKKNVILIILVLLCCVTTLKVSIAMGIFRNDFEKRWEDLSSDVQRLNAYTATRPVELRNVKVDDKNLSGAHFVGATFSGVEWHGTSLKNSKFTNTFFKDCQFIGSLYQGSVFTDVVFENCTFHSAEFGRSTFLNVKFINCKIKDSRMENAEGNEIVFEGTVLETRTSLAGSSIPISFERSVLKGAILSGMKMPNKLTIIDSTLEEVDFSRGHFSDIVIKKSKQSGGGARFNNITAKSLAFEDVDMTKGMAIARSQVGLVRVSGGRFGVAFAESTIPKIYIRDAELYCLDFAEAKLDYVEIANSNLYDTGMWDGYIDQFLVKNSTFANIDSENFKADVVVWDNVTLDGKIDLTSAQVNDFRPTQLTRGPNLQLITTGSNMRFN